MQETNQAVNVVKADNGYVVEFWHKDGDKRTILICKNIREVGKTLAVIFEGKGE
jgi:hypothetical protein